MQKIAEPRRSHERYAIDQAVRGARRVLLERVPHGASVLDVGCWSGAAGKFLVEHRRASVDGIEPEPAMAALAARICRNVFVGSFEDFLSSRSECYDRLLFLDVLEHLPDPSEALRRSKQLVYPDGGALVSIPNVAYWWVRKELLCGRWRYTDSGLLDRTHLWFFTLESAAELLADAGWSIRWNTVSIGQPPLVSLPEKWLRLLRRWPSLFGVQALFEIEPTN
jgi:2-polyprenyl-3-methyl-5-hydroxy-6-metoxy-1,4-benzoquinol methylase